jgi:phage/plasmid-associated DNA primase
MNILLLNAKQLIESNFKFVHYQSLPETKLLWRSKSDSASAWITEHTQMNPDFKINSQEFYEYYRQWCLKSNEKVLSDRMLFGKLEGMTPARKMTTRENKKNVRLIVGCKPKKITEEELAKKSQVQL